MCCSLHRFAVRVATHYHTQAWQMLKHGNECFNLSFCISNLLTFFSCVLMFGQAECNSMLRFAVRAETHYHTQAWQMLEHGNECFILSLCISSLVNKTWKGEYGCDFFNLLKGWVVNESHLPWYFMSHFSQDHILFWIEVSNDSQIYWENFMEILICSNI